MKTDILTMHLTPPERKEGISDYSKNRSNLYNNNDAGS
jgi:hypothetical protein